MNTLQERIPVSTFIPYDKSWMIHMGVLDLLNGHDSMIDFLKEDEGPLPADLKALLQASIDWKKGDIVRVGESGTLFRFLQFAAWKRGEDRTFIKDGTLLGRAITNDPQIVTWPVLKLLTLDNGTSQWASAAMLMQEKPEMPSRGAEQFHANLPYKLRLTHEAMKHWYERRAQGLAWETRLDMTIERQANALVDLANDIPHLFVPEHSEDYCFARAFGFISAEEAEHKWPSLEGHESKRLKEMEKALSQLRAGETITSRDHRVIQAIAMKAKVDRLQEPKVLHPTCVTKRWPLFWDLIKIV